MNKIFVKWPNCVFCYAVTLKFLLPEAKLSSIRIGAHIKMFLTILGLILATVQLYAAGPPGLSWTKKVGARKSPTSKQQYWVNNYDALSDGRKVTTAAIQKAIDDCASKGGGVVSFKPGIYLTGSIFPKSNVRLKIDKGVLIRQPACTLENDVAKS